MGSCVRCGKANEYQATDYRCHECFGAGSPRQVWSDSDHDDVEDTSSPITWPTWWVMSKLSQGQGFCSVHRDYFPSRGCCLDCVAEKRI